MICESTKRVASDDRVIYAFLRYNPLGKGASPQILVSKAPGSSTQNGGFEGSCKVKAKAMTRFQYLCWRYAAKVMEFIGGGTDPGH